MELKPARKNSCKTETLPEAAATRRREREREERESMADAVRHVIESMIPELDALEERGLFTKQELQEVVKRRTEHEYAIRRPGGKATVADFIRYVEYETKMEELRKLRTKTPRAIEAKKNKKLRKKTKGRAEFCIVRRLHFIFSRAINK